MEGKGLVISGDAGKIVVRQKAGITIELGELLVAEGTVPILLHVYDLSYGSQISQQHLELVAGMQLEQQATLSFFDPELRHYQLALLKPVAFLASHGARPCKVLPAIFSPVRSLEAADIRFLQSPASGVLLGWLRSGSRVLDVPIALETESLLSHHVLIAATTGRGKSNLVRVLLWNMLEYPHAGMLVLDPHDEYYGRTGDGLKDHPAHERLVYYTNQHPPPGARTLRITLDQLTPGHFSGALDWTPPQHDALAAYFKRYGKSWIPAIIREEPLAVTFHEGTLSVVRRRLLNILDVELDSDERTLHCHGVFQEHGSASTVQDIVRDLSAARVVVLDTSSFSGAAEILIGSLLTQEVFRSHQQAKRTGQLASLPVVGIVLEEAPRVLGKDVLAEGPNIFATIAREGRKFKVGIVAITQLPSMIPRDILANINTKIILGLEMQPERQAVIESAAQDLSTEHRTIASLDKGEALLTSNFVPFALPLKIPLFAEIVREGKKVKEREKRGVRDERAFVGVQE